MNDKTQSPDLVAFRARQKGRNRVLGVILVALAVLFFAITIVKIATPPEKPDPSVHLVGPGH